MIKKSILDFVHMHKTYILVLCNSSLVIKCLEEIELDHGGRGQELDEDWDIVVVLLLLDILIDQEWVWAGDRVGLVDGEEE